MVVTQVCLISSLIACPQSKYKVYNPLSARSPRPFGFWEACLCGYFFYRHILAIPRTKKWCQLWWTCDFCALIAYSFGAEGMNVWLFHAILHVDAIISQHTHRLYSMKESKNFDNRRPGLSRRNPWWSRRNWLFSKTTRRDSIFISKSESSESHTRLLK